VQTVTDGAERKLVAVFQPIDALLFERGDDPAVPEDDRGRVMKEVGRLLDLFGPVPVQASGQADDEHARNPAPQG
jgi:hypothetical protein